MFVKSMEYSSDDNVCDLPSDIDSSGGSDEDDEEGMFDMFTQEVRIRPNPTTPTAKSEFEWEMVPDPQSRNLAIRVKDQQRPGSHTMDEDSAAMAHKDSNTEETWTNIPNELESSVASCDLLSIDSLPTQPYEWNPLKHHDSIRVLDILPSQTADPWNEPIQVHLRHLSLKNFTYKPADCYQTLSYAWGPKTADGAHLTEKIYCDGGVLRITANLHAGLRRIRQRLDDGELSIFGRRTPIWVDAICINQNDVGERGEQVHRMARIYSNSSRVIVWLGETDFGVDWELERAGSRLASDSTFSFSTSSPDERIGCGSGSEHLGLHKAKDAMKHLLRQPWFKRRWVIQEYGIKSIRTVMFGGAIMDSSRFVALLTACGLHQEAGPMTYTRLFDSFRVKRWLPITLHRFREAQCADAHDLIYSLLPVSCGCGDAKSVCDPSKNDKRRVTWMDGKKKYRSLPDCDPLQSARIDYEQDVERLFHWLARCWTERDVILVLAMASIRRSGLEGAMSPPSRLPSWVPDWRRPASSSSAATREFIEECIQEVDKSWTTLSNNCRMLSGQVWRPSVKKLGIIGWLFKQTQRSNDGSRGSQAGDTSDPLMYQVQGSMDGKRWRKLRESDGTEETSGDQSVCATALDLTTRATAADKAIARYSGTWPQMGAGEVVCLLPGSRLGFVLKRRREEDCYELRQCFKRPLVPGSHSSFVFHQERDNSVWMAGSLAVEQGLLQDLVLG